MKMRFSLLPVAIALTACFWVSDAMAQAVTIPAGAIEESRAPVPAGIGTHGSEDHPGAGNHPGTGELLGPGDRPGTAQPGTGPALDSAAVLRQQALTAMETLREEIATLAALKHAQAALLAWNRAGSDVGEAPVFLAATLCAEPALGAWCPLLPATFGTPRREDSHDRD